jgi:chloramphenicol 3-O phosphotransferase
MILFLNGVSSSGKSSISKCLQDLWPTPLLHVGVDHFLDLMPKRFCGESAEAALGLRFVRKQTKDGPVVEIEQGEYARRLFAGMIQAIKALALEKNDLIVDEVLFGDVYLRR